MLAFGIIFKLGAHECLILNLRPFAALQGSKENLPF